MDLNKKNIVYLGYWGVNDGLTVSVINPHLELLVKYKNLSKIYFVTIERNENGTPNFLGFDSKKKIIHVPLVSKNHKINLLNKTNDFILFPKLIGRLLDVNAIDLLITHGMVSGSLAYLTCVKRNIPYIVFAEPHSRFMLESGVWKKNDPRYIYQKKWEKKQIKTARKLYTVTKNYYNFLKDQHEIEEGRVSIAPNAVNLSEFKFDNNKRSKIRSSLGFSNETIVGIYVGKFGGIYLEEGAFSIFNECQKQFGENFRLVILTPQTKEEVLSFCSINSLSKIITIDKVNHDKVNEYLSAADFGFSIQYPKDSNRFLCPLKNGEYWASGLPILIIDGVGDDTEIIKKEGGGAVFDLECKDSIIIAINKIKSCLKKKSDRLNNTPRKLAEKYRNITIVEEIFNDHIN